MSYIKNSIPDDYSCNHFDDPETCLECQYALHTQKMKAEYRPSLENWYNRPTPNKSRKKRRNK